MPGGLKKIILSRDLVETGRRLFPQGTPGPLPTGRRPPTDSDLAAMADAVLADAPRGPLQIFAYGSLIWNPGFAFQSSSVGRAHGWHRAFRLGYDRWYRGSAERPGLMLVLDRGGVCKGVVFRLPERDREHEIMNVLRREVRLVPHSFPPRWIRVQTDEGPVRALTFAMDRTSANYVTGLPYDELVRILATASGSLGSMADYLLSTVEHLDALGLHDRMLWRLQADVARYLQQAEQDV